MGKFILAVIAAVVLFMIVTAVISALHFLFSLVVWVAVIALVIFGALKLSSGMRRRARR